MLSFLTALQDPGSAAAGFIHGAETAIGQGVSDVTSALDTLKSALTGSGATASAAASALSTGSAAATTLASSLTSALGAFAGLDHHHGHHHHGGVSGATSSGGISTASAAASALSLVTGVSAGS